MSHYFHLSCKEHFVPQRSLLLLAACSSAFLSSRMPVSVYHLFVFERTLPQLEPSQVLWSFKIYLNAFSLFLIKNTLWCGTNIPYSVHSLLSLLAYIHFSPWGLLIQADRLYLWIHRAVLLTHAYLSKRWLCPLSGIWLQPYNQLSVINRNIERTNLAVTANKHLWGHL